MICAEAVKPRQYAVEALRKQVLNRKPARAMRALVYPRESAQISGKMASRKEMRPGPATPAASCVDLKSCLPAARSSETTVLVRQRSRGVPHLPVLAAEHDSENMILRIASLQPC